MNELAQELNAVGATAGVEAGRLYLVNREAEELHETNSFRVCGTCAGPDVYTDGKNGFVLQTTRKADGKPVAATYQDGRWS